MKLNREAASKFIGNCQYLKGKEIPLKINGKETKGVVKSIGAFSWKPKSSRAQVELYANVDIGKRKTVKVDLMSLYKKYPLTYFRKMKARQEQQMLDESNSGAGENQSAAE